MMKVRQIATVASAARLYAVMACMGAAFLLLAGTLWRLQVMQMSHFQSRQQIQSLRRVRLPGIRGKIYDRNGFCLADNRPVYSIVLYPEEIRRPGPFAKTVDHACEVISETARITGLTPGIDRKAVQRHIDWYRPYPLVLWRDVGARAMARLSEQGGSLPGVDLNVQSTRLYPGSPSTSHIVGYVREGEPDPDRGERFHYQLPEMTGRAGLEKLFDPFLRGEAGAKLVQVDVGIYRHGELAVRAPKAGGDLRLTLDMEIQRLAQQAMDGHRGAVVVLDPGNGDVLAMVSAPGFDANLFVPFITTGNWRNLSEDTASPLFNRAACGTYSPGSTFKPLVGLAAATTVPGAAYAVYDSPAEFRIGGRVVRTTGHGEVSLRDALKYSANVYFFKLALECGRDVIIRQALAAGLGRKTGVEVDAESSGLVPDDNWIRARRVGWSDGDTCNLAIGQGYLTVTPLQMAMVTAAIANGGWLYGPRLVQSYRPPEAAGFTDNPPRRVGKTDWPEDALNVVRDGMRDVIMSTDGTGRGAAVDGLVYAGKTGTAEYGPRGSDLKHTWMIAFAPFDEPRYAVAFLIEDGVSGGQTVAPRMKFLMEGLFEKMKREGRVS